MKFRVLFVGLSMLLLLFGCQNPMNQEGRAPERDQTIQPTRYGDDRGNLDRREQVNEPRRDERRTERARDHNRYDVAKEAADRITSELREVNQAYVLTTNNNAYVAVILDNDQRKSTGERTDRREDRTERRENINRDRSRTRIDGDRRGRADNDLSDRIFIGRDDDISDDLKHDIAQIVRSVDNRIDNVYVSSNPDFVDLTNNYIDDVNAGRPIRGFFDEMSNMIERIFPQNR